MRYGVLFICLFAVTFSAHAQSSTKKQKSKNYYVYADTGFIEETPDRGAWMKAYYTSDSLKKIEAYYGFNFGDLRRSFYYWDDHLVLVLETQRLYNNSASNPINADSVKPNYEGRYVFERDSLTSVKQTGHFSFLDTPADKNSMEKTFVTMSTTYMSLFDELRKNKKNRIKIKNK